MLATKNGESLPEDIEGHIIVVGHRWVCLAADCGSEVHSFGQWVIHTHTHRFIDFAASWLD